jgi:hypothetical protein
VTYKSCVFEIDQWTFGERKKEGETKKKRTVVESGGDGEEGSHAFPPCPSLLVCELGLAYSGIYAVCSSSSALACTYKQAKATYTLIPRDTFFSSLFCSSLL